ncbi:MAG: phosphatase PAP2 family protein [Micrococcaceae bacterium]
MSSNPMDMYWLNLMISSRDSVLTLISLVFNYSLNVISALFFVLAAYYYFYERATKKAIFVLAVFSIRMLLVEGLKFSVQRQRPPLADRLVHASGYSFPSGHTATMTCFVVMLSLLYPKLWIKVTGVVLALTMAWSRTYVAAHWLSDVLAGLLCGVLSTYLAYYLVNRYYQAGVSIHSASTAAGRPGRGHKKEPLNVENQD